MARDLAARIDIVPFGKRLAPGTIASAILWGHRYAREMDTTPLGGVRFRREHALAP